jgi:hypothetical protein
MNTLQRLKLELNNKQYFTDEEYSIFLTENNLDPIATYTKETHQRDLLYTCIDVLESLANDTDMMTKVETEFLTTSECVKWIEQRIQSIQQRINNIEVVTDQSPFTLLFNR